MRGRLMRVGTDVGERGCFPLLSRGGQAKWKESNGCVYERGCVREWGNELGETKRPYSGTLWLKCPPSGPATPEPQGGRVYRSKPRPPLDHHRARRPGNPESDPLTGPSRPTET